MVTRKFFLRNKDEIINILGIQDLNLRHLEKKLKVQIFVHHDPEEESAVLSIRGSTSNTDKALRQIKAMLLKLLENKLPPKEISLEETLPANAVFKTEYGQYVYPRSENQKKYVDAILKGDMVVGIGPAGTGKTYLAAACALKALKSDSVKRIILTRPIVEAGEKLGFLPGDIYEKVHPYLKPLYDAFYSLLGPEKFRMLREDEVIETVPLAYMRGRTLEHSFIILDEAQNTLPEQMKMFLTRMGLFSKIVITGDITQIDLMEKEKSGLVLIQDILKKVHPVKFIHFNTLDVIRHPIVKEIINAYEEWEKGNSK
ncbi:MAG: PhoH family protein [Elusimicrobiota bacterium]